MKILLMSSVIAVIIGGVLFCGDAFAQSAGGPSLVQYVGGVESWYPIGEQVTIVYTLCNRGSGALTYEFRTGKQYDIWVTFGGNEVFRSSKGMMSVQAFTKLILKSDESKEYRAVWNQKDLQGRPVVSGWYTVHAQLLPNGGKPYEVSSRIWIGEPSTGVVVGVVPLFTVAEANRRFNEYNGKSVRIVGTYKGSSSKSSARNSKNGLAVSNSDWTVSDSTGSMNVSGKATLDSASIAGAKVSVQGKLFKLPNGQIYMLLESATLQK